MSKSPRGGQITTRRRVVWSLITLLGFVYALPSMPAEAQPWRQIAKHVTRNFATAAILLVLLAILVLINLRLIESAWHRVRYGTWELNPKPQPPDPPPPRSVPASHSQFIKQGLESVRSSVNAKHVCDYGPDHLQEEAIHAHYPALRADLNRWDNLINRLSTNEQLVRTHLAIRGAALEISEPEYDGSGIINYLYKEVLEHARTARLGKPITFNWKYYNSHDQLYVYPWHGAQEPWITLDYDPGAHDDDEAFLSWIGPFTKRVEELAHEALLWQESNHVVQQTYERDTTGPALSDQIGLTIHQDPILETDDCPICLLNAPSTTQPKPLFRFDPSSGKADIYPAGAGIDTKVTLTPLIGGSWFAVGATGPSKMDIVPSSGAVHCYPELEEINSWLRATINVNQRIYEKNVDLFVHVKNDGATADFDARVTNITGVKRQNYTVPQPSWRHTSDSRVTIAGKGGTRTIHLANVSRKPHALWFYTTESGKEQAGLQFPSQVGHVVEFDLEIVNITEQDDLIRCRCRIVLHAAPELPEFTIL